MVKCEFCDWKCDCDKKIKVSFCPKCKSYDVKDVFGIGNLFGVLPRQRCGGCGRTGVFPILVVDKSKLKGGKKR